MAEKETKATPAYIAYDTLAGLVDKLVQNTVPTKIDRGVLGNYSGGVQAQIKPALRFLGLIEEDDRSTDALKALVKARAVGEEAWKKELRDTLSRAYGAIVEGVSLTNGTARELDEAFQKAGVPQGDMLKKTTRFYVRALVAAGVNVSPYIRSGRGSGSNGKPAKSRTPRKRRVDGAVATKPADPIPHTPPPPAGDVPPSGFERLAIPGRDKAFIQYPLDLTEADCLLFEAQLQTLRVFLGAQTKGAKK